MLKRNAETGLQTDSLYENDIYCIFSIGSIGVKKHKEIGLETAVSEQAEIRPSTGRGHLPMNVEITLLSPKLKMGDAEPYPRDLVCSFIYHAITFWIKE